MANTYILIEGKTLSSAVASVTFTSIPQTYTDLQLVLSTRATQNVGRELLKVYPNGSTTSNDRIILFGYDTAGADRGVDTDKYIGWQSGNSTTANTFSSASLYFPSYTSGNYKLYSADATAENNSSSSWVMNISNTVWSNSSAITSIEIACETSTFAVNSTFYLYGIKNS